MLFKKWDKLKNNQNFFSIKLIIKFLIRLKKVQKLIYLIINYENIKNIVSSIYYQNNFLFIYNIYKFIEIKKDYLKLKYNINHFKVKVKAVIEF